MKKTAIFTSALLLSISAFILPLSARGSSGGSSSGKGESARTVSVWSWFIQVTMEKIIRAFEKENPGIKVKYTYYNYSPEYITALKAASTSGNLPDVIGLQPGAFTQKYREHLVPLNKLAQEEWGKGWSEKIFPINLKQMRLGNPPGDQGYYILPQESQVLAVWYNRLIFRELGLGVPQSYAGLVRAAQTLRENNYIPLYQGAADGWQNINVFLMIANQFSPGIIERAENKQVPWSDPKIIESFRAWENLFRDGVFQKGALGTRAYPTGAQLLANGKVGMMTLGSWYMQESKFPGKLSKYIEGMQGLDYFYFPRFPRSLNDSVPVGGIDIGYGLTQNGKDNPDAWKLLASLVNGSGLQQALNDLNNLPAFKGHQPEGDINEHTLAMYNRFLGDLQVAENQRIASPKLQDALENVLAGLAAGDMTAQEAGGKLSKLSKLSY